MGSVLGSFSKHIVLAINFGIVFEPKMSVRLVVPSTLIDWERKSLNSSLSIEEVEVAVWPLKDGNYVGEDEFLVELYKVMWDVIIENTIRMYMKLFSQALLEGILMQRLFQPSTLTFAKILAISIFKSISSVLGKVG